MKNSDLLKVLAEANRKVGMIRQDQNYIRYANLLDNAATIKEAEEIKDEPASRSI